MIKKILLAVAALGVAVVTAGAASPAAGSSVDLRVLEAVQNVPGGVIVDAHTATWPDLSMTLTVPDALPQSSIGTCPNGSVCVFSGTSLTGARLSWTSCGTFSTAALGSAVRSLADARSTGHADARDGTTVLATAYAQSWNNVSGTADNVACY